MKKYSLCMMCLLALANVTIGAEPENLALKATATASSVLEKKYSADKAVDGRLGNDSRWVSARGPGPHILTLELKAKRQIGCLQLITGWKDGNAWIDPIRDFVLQSWDGAQWRDIPGTTAQDNGSPGLQFLLATPIETDKVRLVATGDGPARVMELRVFAVSSTGYPPPLTDAEKGTSAAVANIPAVLVNQSGYNLDWPKRFTAPLVEGETDFIISKSGGKEVLYRGKLQNGVGDFTDFRPSDAGADYVIKLAKGGSSDPFRVAPFWMERVALELGLRFFVDARSVVGTHPSAYGGCPWRDSTYYTFDVPALVMLYLANPDFFEHLPIEINYAADKAKVLAPDFKLVKAANDSDALATARGYYEKIEPPVGAQVPDIIQCIHWGVGWYLVNPETHDPSGDPLGKRLHPQTLEQIAFFLYGYPAYRQHFTDGFNQKARGLAFGQWEKAGLLEVIKTIGDFKGRECPGHSILPNLMLYEVAKRDGRTDADRYFQAAFNQTKWVIDELDFNDPRTTKGQRMSEHKLIPALVTFLREYPDRAPAGLKQKLAQWADIMIARSDNLWDFRKYDAENWSLPRFTPGSHGGAGWNEPGNLAAFPALCFTVASVLDDAGKANRLRQIGVAQFDNLFGRNPLSAHSGWRGPMDYLGVERGWPKQFPTGVCARLELVRGTLNSSAATEHYPLNPNGAFRHPEGWTAFNAAFNVGLAYTCWADTRLSIRDNVVELSAPVFTDEATVTVTPLAGRPTPLVLKRPKPDSGVLRGTLPAELGGKATVAYGFGYFQQRAEVK